MTNATATILDPTGEVYREPHASLTRPETLQGLTVALLDNHKPESVIFMDVLGEVFAHDFGARIIRRGKPNLSRPCPEDILQELVVSTDLLVAGVGV